MTHTITEKTTVDLLCIDLDDAPSALEICQGLDADAKAKAWLTISNRLYMRRVNPRNTCKYVWLYQDGREA